MSIVARTVLSKYIAKLERHVSLPLIEKEAFLSLSCREESIDANRNIVRTGSEISRCIFLGTGMMSRVKTLPSGERQIVAFNIPGDAPDLQSLLLRVADHSLYTHTLTHIVSVSHADIRLINRECPVLAEALWLDTLIEASIHREWTVNVGQRKATARIAHLLLELEARFSSIGQSPGTYVLPLNQTFLSQALALSLVHTNKSLQLLRVAGIVTVKAGRVVISDRAAMLELSGFDDTYLHLSSSQVETIGAVCKYKDEDQSPAETLPQDDYDLSSR